MVHHVLYCLAWYEVNLEACLVMFYDLLWVYVEPRQKTIHYASNIEVFILAPPAMTHRLTLETTVLMKTGQNSWGFRLLKYKAIKSEYFEHTVGQKSIWHPPFVQVVICENFLPPVLPAQFPNNQYLNKLLGKSLHSAFLYSYVFFP